MNPPAKHPTVISHFVFCPSSICFGADPGMTVITAYAQLENDLIAAAKARRNPAQLGEPVAMIAAWDLEDRSIYLYCVDTFNTHCSIPLMNIEAQALYNCFVDLSMNAYHDTPEHILNIRRLQHHLAPILNGRPDFCVS